MAPEKSEPLQNQSAKPMPAIVRFRLFDTGNPNLLGIGIETVIGSVLVAAHRRQVLEMIAKLTAAVEGMSEPS